MPTDFLTAHKVRSISETGSYLDGRGLRLIVTGSGTKRWELWIKINGRRRELGLGVYPDVTLEDARHKANGMRRAVRDGGDVPTKRSAQTLVNFRDAFKTCIIRSCTTSLI